MKSSKTVLLAIIAIIALVGGIAMGLYALSDGEPSIGIGYISIGIITFAFIKGFADIIDLLDSINNKLDKK